MSILIKTRNLSLALGLAYVILIGFGRVGINFQASLFHASFLAILWILLRAREIRLSRYHHLVFALGLALSVFFSVTTNELLYSVTYLTLCFLTSLLLLLNFEKRSPGGPVQYIKAMIRYVGYAMSSGLSISRIKEFVSIGENKVRLHIKKETVYGLAISLPILAVFNFFFARINVDYAFFVNSIFEQVWRVIRYILDIEILWVALKGILQGYFFYTLLTVEHNRENYKIMAKNWPVTILKMMLASVVLLFLVFSSFQSKLLFLDVFHLGFKEVSQYVQQGFIELLLVSFGGYALSLFVLKRIPKKSGKVRWLLVIFGVELMVISMFMFHKLYALQAVFGFKDQRILATVAVLLILMTFVFLLLRILKRVTATRIFRWQVILLATMVLGLNWLNIDLFIGKHNSIRYIKDEIGYKDYSYLLGNSYDNVSLWPGLMEEAQRLGIPKPDETYYWGHFSTSRKDFYGSVYNPICERRIVYSNLNVKSNSTIDQKYVYSSYLENHYQDLTDKYGRFGTKTPLAELAKFNIREYGAYRFVRDNKALVDKFIEFAKDSCKI